LLRLSDAHFPLPTAFLQCGHFAGGARRRTGFPPHAGQRFTVLTRARLQAEHLWLSFVGTDFAQ
jgi:hypothetical protein